MNDGLTFEDRRVLKWIQGFEKEMLREDVWVNPFRGPGVAAHVVAANMEWTLPVASPDDYPTPDDDKAQPVLEKLVRLGYLVEIGERPHLLTKKLYKQYATPGFKEKLDSLWRKRQHQTWQEIHEEAGVTPIDRL